MDITVPYVLYTLLVLFVTHRLLRFFFVYVRQLQASRKVIKYPGTTFLTGSVMQFESFDEYEAGTMKQILATKCKIQCVWVYFFYPYFILSHPDTVKVIMKSNNVPKSFNVGSPYKMLRPWIGDGILAIIGGKRWERNRRLLTNAFHFDILKGYVGVFNAVAEDFLIKLSQHTNHSFDVSGAVKVATLDALLRCAFSYTGRIQEQGFDHPYVAAVQEISSIIIYRITHPIMFLDFIFNRTVKGKRFHELCNYVHKFAEDIIVSRKQHLKEQSDHPEKRHRDFLDILLLSRDEQGQGLSDTEVREEADTFLFAGHDTTSSAIGFAIHALAEYPDEQQRLYEEVMEVVGNRPVEWDDLPSLKYTLRFIKEVMRMYSTVPLLSRGLVEPMEIGGVKIPALTPIEINIHAINHRPDVWPDHDVFRPDRFLVEDPDRDPFTYIPFSAGNRNCIGQNFALMEQKVMLARIVQTFLVEKDVSHVLQTQLSLVMQSKNGIKVVFRSRR